MELRNVVNPLDYLPRRRRRIAVAAMCAVFVVALPSLWSFADGFAADHWPRYRIHRLRQQSLSEVEQERFRKRNERLVLKEVGLPPSFAVTDITTRTHTLESSNDVYAVSSRIQIHEPEVIRASSAWFEENRTPCLMPPQAPDVEGAPTTAPARSRWPEAPPEATSPTTAPPRPVCPGPPEEINKPVSEAFDGLISALRDRGYDRERDELHDGVRYVTLEKEGGVVRIDLSGGIGGILVEVKRLA